MSSFSGFFSGNDIVHPLEESQKWFSYLEKYFPTEKGMVSKFTDDILLQLKNNNWSDDLAFSIELALEEALMNAVEHGNKYDPAKRVLVRCVLSSEIFRIEITDEGPGFVPKEVADPTLSENLNHPSGRGVLLMKTFMDVVQYNPKGNKVFMEKRIKKEAEMTDPTDSPSESNGENIYETSYEPGYEADYESDS